MAAGILSVPGSGFGPCKRECQHIDCQKTRAMAVIKCRICEKAISYNRRFYEETSGSLVHAECLEDFVLGNEGR